MSGDREDRKSNLKHGNAEARRRSMIGTYLMAAVAPRGWFPQAKVLVLEESLQDEACLRSTIHLVLGANRSRLVAPWSESEVAVNRFEGHGARRAFRPKVNGWSEERKRNWRSNMRMEAFPPQHAKTADAGDPGESRLWQQMAQNLSR